MSGKFENYRSMAVNTDDINSEFIKSSIKAARAEAVNSILKSNSFMLMCISDDLDGLEVAFSATSPEDRARIILGMIDVGEEFLSQAEEDE